MATARRRGASERPKEAAIDPATVARGICLRLLTARPCTRVELATALRRRGIADDVAGVVLDRLDEVGLVDDAAVAELAVRSAQIYRGLGRRALGAELRRRGVPDEIARTAVAAVDSQDEEARARELVRRRLRSATKPDETTLIRRLVGMLARKGYPEGLAFQVVREEVRDSTGSDPGMLGPDTD